MKISKHYIFLFLHFVIQFGLVYAKISLFWNVIVFFLWLFIVVIGTSRMRWNFFLKNFCEGRGISEKIICLTFDDGPTEYTIQVLDLLKKYNQKATFFCIGNQVEKYPQIIKKILSEGNEIGNHSYTHPISMGFLSPKKVREEIQKCDALLQKNNVFTALYRPPFGITNPSISKAILQEKKISIGWDIRSFDTLQDGEDKIFQRVIPRIKSGAVVLLHDTSEMSVAVLEKILIFLKENNYRSITISEMIKLNKNEA